MNDAEARDDLRIIGSSTVFPFATATGEMLTKAGMPTPKITSTTSGKGMKIFCSGVGAGFPDIANTSRPISGKEVKDCAQNGVEYTEVKVGNDANVLAFRSELGVLQLTGEQIWRAVAAQVPVDGVLAANPYRMWNEIDPSLPAKPIQVYGPPVGAGVRDGFVDQFIIPACAADPAIAALPAEAMKETCSTFRADGSFVEFEKAAEVMLALPESEAAVGMTSYSLIAPKAKENGLALAQINGVAPSPNTIAAGEYKGSQALYIYLKTAHLDTVPGIKEFAEEFVSDRASGKNGYLVAMGLVPLTDDQRREMQTRIASMAATN
jgi:phosphate transport system substrate-binding protein